MTAIHGAANGAWRGDDALTTTKRARAQRAYPLTGISCERCGEPATDRHHKDEDTGNNEPENVALLCRRCHMLVDGRLDRLRDRTEQYRQPQPAAECKICLTPSKPMRRGRCHACNEYLRRHGVERSEYLARKAVANG